MMNILQFSLDHIYNRTVYFDIISHILAPVFQTYSRVQIYAENHRFLVVHTQSYYNTKPTSFLGKEKRQGTVPCLSTVIMPQLSTVRGDCSTHKQQLPCRHLQEQIQQQAQHPA